MPITYYQLLITYDMICILLKKSTLSIFNVDFLLDLSEIFAKRIQIGKLNLSH